MIILMLMVMLILNINAERQQLGPDEPADHRMNKSILIITIVILLRLLRIIIMIIMIMIVILLIIVVIILMLIPILILNNTMDRRQLGPDESADHRVVPPLSMVVPSVSAVFRFPMLL